MKSTAAVAHSLRSPFVVEEVELPDLQHTDVLVRPRIDVRRSDGALRYVRLALAMLWFLPMSRASAQAVAAPASARGAPPTVSQMPRAGAPDDSAWRGLPDGSSEWSVLAVGGRTNLGGVYGLARSEVTTRLALSAFQWSRVLTAAHGPKPLRGQLQMGVELVPLLRAVQNRPTLGFGVSPVFLRWRFLGTRRFQPYLEGLAGIARTDQQLPEGTTRFNFTSQAGLGARIAVSDDLGLLVGYRFDHLSNAGRRPRNPGLNFHVVYVGLSWILPNDGPCTTLSANPATDRCSTTVPAAEPRDGAVAPAPRSATPGRSSRDAGTTIDTCVVRSYSRPRLSIDNFERWQRCGLLR